MIQSAKEAREIIGSGYPYGQHVAEAYFAALQGPEVKALVEFVEDVRHGIEYSGWFNGAKDLHIKATNLLAQYREAVEP